MVAPILAALISGGTTLAGGLLGAGAESDAANLNYQLGLLNYYQREQERRDAINEAKRQRQDAYLGATDAQGNRTYFIPGKGWVTDLTPESEALQDAFQAEEMRIIGQDLPAKRQQMFANLARQRGEGGYANALMEAMGRVQRDSPRDVINRRNQMAGEGITEGFDDTQEAAMRNLARTGSSNQSKVLSELAGARSKALRNAFMQNAEGARAESEDTYSRRLGNMSQLYNMFATRASAMPDAQFRPRDISGPSQEGARAAGQSAGSNLINAFAKQGGTFSEVEPRYGMANTIAQTGSALMAALGRQAGREQMDQGYGAYNDFLGGSAYPAAPSVWSSPYKGTNSEVYKQGTGLW